MKDQSSCFRRGHFLFRQGLHRATGAQGIAVRLPDLSRWARRQTHGGVSSQGTGQTLKNVNGVFIVLYFAVIGRFLESSESPENALGSEVRFAVSWQQKVLVGCALFVWKTRRQIPHTHRRPGLGTSRRARQRAKQASS